MEAIRISYDIEILSDLEFLMKDSILPEFPSYLVPRGLVPEKNVPLYAHWISRFLAFLNRDEDLERNLRSS
jgi:hypothetical protein